MTQGVDLFPLAGVTPGSCGILVSQPTRTILIAGDAVATREHLEDAQVLPYCWDRKSAQDSFAEAIEIADIIVPGRDNILLNPTRAR
jgi:glyoxylase-like metal-dependent hydrolase (beta-lactamase superfamily II)